MWNSNHCNCAGINDNPKVISDSYLKMVNRKSKKRKDVLHASSDT